MIKSIMMRNFQKWKKLKLNLNHPITVIIGPTRTGKTSIIRALNWVCFNKPAGNEFLRWGSKQVGARLNVDGHIIERIRGKENLYRLDGEDLKSFGRTNVPDPIKRILNLSEENIQNQLDTAFWLSLSPPQIGRELNQIVDLGLVDNSMSYIAKKVRYEKSKKSVIEERLQEAKATKKKLKYVPQLAKDFKELNTLGYELDEKRGVVSDLGDLLDTIKEKKQEYKRLDSFILKCSVSFKEIEQLSIELRKKKKSVEELSDLLHSIKTKQASKSQLRKEISVLKSKLEKQRCPTCGAKLNKTTQAITVL